MKLVVFDIDGTLTNTKEIDDLCFINSVKECWECNLGEVDWSTFLHVTDTGLAKDIFRTHYNKEITDSEILRLKKVFSSKIISESKVSPEAFLEIKGASDFIKELESQDMKLAIATGGWKVTAEHKLKQINLELSKFPHATSDDHYSRKEILLKSIKEARDHYNINFNRILYFGDGLWDHKVTCELGIEFIGIDCNKNGKLIKAGAKTVFQDYRDKGLIIEAIREKIGL